jgi:hypothetical protein
LRVPALTFAELVGRFRGPAKPQRDGVLVFCPLHEDHDQSLSLRRTRDRFSVHCFAGCEHAALLRAAGLSLADLGRNDRRNGHGARGDVATYVYTDDAHQPLYRAVRAEPRKRFRLEHPEGGVWVKGRGDAPLTLYNLPALAGQRVVLLPEGEKCADTLNALGLPWVATATAMGAASWRETYARQLATAGCRVLVTLPDHDDAGERYNGPASHCARDCLAIGIDVRVLRLPDLAPSGDIVNWLAAGHKREELVTLIEACLAAAATDRDGAPGGHGGPDEPTTTSPNTDTVPDAASLPPMRPGLEVPRTFYDLRALAERTWETIEQNNTPPTLFRCGGIAWIEDNEQGRRVVRQLDAARLRHWLSNRIAFFRTVNHKARPVRPPRDLLDDLLVRPEPPLPILTRIIAAPVVAADGTIHTSAGYHPATRAFYAPVAGFSVPPVSVTPTMTEMATARELLLEAFGDFPFKGQPDRAHTLAALLSVFARDLIDGPTPLILLTKPAPGTGATLIVNTISVIALGSEPQVMTLPADGEEVRKKLTATLRAAPSITVLDNLRGVIDSGDLSSILTARTWEDRLLGKHEQLYLPVRTVWLGTSNNAALTTELSRRTVRVGLDAAVERPWLRARDGLVVFKHPDLLAWAAARRGDLVHACLTLIAGWLAAGRPRGTDTLGMYEEWAAIVGGILAVAGIDGFLGNAVEFYQGEDAESLDLRRLVLRWWQVFREAPTPPSELLRLAQEPDIDLPLSGKDDAARRISLGRYLQKHKERTLDLDADTSVQIAKADRPGRPFWRLFLPKSPAAREGRDSAESATPHAREAVMDSSKHAVHRDDEGQDSHNPHDSHTADVGWGSAFAPASILPGSPLLDPDNPRNDLEHEDDF